MTETTARATESIEAFAARAEAWLQENVPVRWRDSRGSLSNEESDEFRRDWDRRLWDGGFAGLGLPREFGGAGLGLAEEVTFHVLAAKAQAPDGLARIGKILTAPMLIANGTDEQQEKYLRPILNGDEIWCQGFSEPHAGSDLAGVTTRAVKVDGGYRITGRKIWTSFVQHAHRAILLAQTDADAPRHKNLGMFLLDMRQPGITVSDIRQISGAVHFAEVQFEDVFVPDSDLVGGEVDGWKVAMKVLTDERGGTETATRYVEIRADLDLLLSSCSDRPELAAELNELDIRTELLRWQLSKVVDNEVVPNEKFWRSISVLKVMWSELWQDVTSAGLRALVPADREHWRYQYLESRAASIYSGTNEIQRNIIAERVLGLPR
ncbi:acyl-CoA dehydrogenase [Cryobacterium sp. TMS1-20-1]|uniref:acyl-CoA dehydrogenase family protein n=1 Tax=Cryobacterium sp. TMS1-20-1 TaxID=1259223 RepID=UPI0010696638|nr:acyl-CoA dehydrogenase family protein [Cryobacterium sp. TMS1-20-1]TFC74892.1 acyl-CoA dehydrogenase [Cryobacterium sp. TMS1-20-1]